MFFNGAPLCSKEVKLFLRELLKKTTSAPEQPVLLHVII